MIGQEHSRRKNARRLLTNAGYKVGGHMAHHSDYAADKAMIESAVRQHEDHEHDGRHTKLKLSRGGLADGGMAADRPDRASRSSKGKGTTVNIILSEGGGQQQQQQVPVPVPVRPPMPPPPPGPPPGGGGMPGAPGAMPPRPPMPPPGAPMGMPPGGPPMMRKAGGRAHRQGGGMAGGASTPQNVQAMPVPPYLIQPGQQAAAANPQTGSVQTSAHGGRAERMYGGRAPQAKQHGGAGSGVDRLNRSKEMGRDEARLCEGGRG